MDVPDFDLEKAEKFAKALEYFGLIGLGVLAYLAGHWRAYRKGRPRAQIMHLSGELEALRNLLAELTKSVGADSTNIVSLNDQLEGIVADTDRTISNLRKDNEARYVRITAHDDLCERVQQLDDRLWEISGGAPRRRSIKREARHDPGD